MHLNKLLVTFLQHFTHFVQSLRKIAFYKRCIIDHVGDFLPSFVGIFVSFCLFDYGNTVLEVVTLSPELSIKRYVSRKLLFEPFWALKPVAVSAEHGLAIPEAPDPIEFLTHEPPFGILVHFFNGFGEHGWVRPGARVLVFDRWRQFLGFVGAGVDQTGGSRLAFAQN